MAIKHEIIWSKKLGRSKSQLTVAFSVHMRKKGDIIK